MFQLNNLHNCSLLYFSKKSKTTFKFNLDLFFCKCQVEYGIKFELFKNESIWMSRETGMETRSCVVDGEEKKLLKQECFQKCQKSSLRLQTIYELCFLESTNSTMDAFIKEWYKLFSPGITKPCKLHSGTFYNFHNIKRPL